ncbi:MAG TPA: proton-conducting transporter membrane subunit [Candidatus Limnocylindrales bacterium]
MSSLIAFLVVFPLVVGGLLLGVRNGKLRNVIVVLAGLVVAGASVVTAVTFGNGNAIFFGLPNGLTLGQGLLAAEIAIGLFVVVVSIQHRRILAPILVLSQVAISVYLELSGKMPELDPGRLFWFDRLAMVMVLIIGIVGTLICIHSLGYMRDYHRSSPLIKGRRTVFFCLLFVFLGAMFGLVVSNYLPLMLIFWEMTTLCSFLLIGYTRTKETIGYAFNALNMNMLGGLGFSIAILLLVNGNQSLDLATLTSGPASAALLPALALLCLAGLTKAAQMPFSSWLLGAMYAPSPTSALLHSSTMVKAGVFLLLRLSPAIAGSNLGTLVAFVGMLTFLFVSLVGVTEQNTKKVLAYSTIGSLGLIVGCAGLGSPELIWVGVMIIIFHAVAKGLLFLVVGTIENRLYSKDMENFDTLLSRLPLVSALALTGIAGMFIAPFGVVVAKWTAIRAFLEVPGWQGAALLVIMAFGSSLTIFYWGKLLIKVLSMRSVSEYELSVEKRITRFEWLAEITLAVGVIGVAAFIGVISEQVVGPQALATFKGASQSFLHVEPVMLATMIVAMLFLPLLALWVSRQKHFDMSDFYAAGRPVTSTGVMGAALGGARTVTLRNYYLEGVVNGRLVFRAGTLVCGVLLAALLTVGMVAR